MCAFFKKNITLKSTQLFMLCIVFGVMSTRITAGTAGPSVSTEDYLRYLKQSHLILQLGGYWRNASSEQYIHIDDLIGDRFTVLDTKPKNGLFGVGYFIDGQEHTHFKMSYGLNWFYLPQTRTAGMVFQENEFRNFSYDYNITQYPLYIVAKSIINTDFSNHHLALNMGIGPNFMKTSDFQQHAILSNNITPIPVPIFSGKTNTVFSATAGAGIQVANVFGKAPLECGYQFFYLGQGKFNILNDQVKNTLKTGQLYANAVMCSILV